jgi:predicted DNA-binding ribbon-helix-helix protein
VSRLRKRSVVVSGHHTSVSLEQEFWDELAAIAGRRGVSLNALISRIDRDRGDGVNLSSALRVFVVERLRQGQSRNAPLPEGAESPP